MQVLPYYKRLYFPAFLIEEDTELQRTAAISDHLIKTLTGFLVKSDLDDSSYALMREVSFKGVGRVQAATGTLKKQGGMSLGKVGKGVWLWGRSLGQKAWKITDWRLVRERERWLEGYEQKD